MTRRSVTRAAQVLLPAIVLLMSCRSDRRSPSNPATPPPAWLLARAEREAEHAARANATPDFHFTDRREASGITFVNRSVDDAGKAYKKVHYDHGSGVCAADVDGDELPDLYFVTQLGSNELWRNVGGGRFVNATDQAHLRIPDAIAVACAFADIDNDGDPDLLVTTVRHGNRLFENLGRGEFRDITAQAGVGYSGHSSGAVFFDYDRDGLLDLLVVNVGAYTTNVRGRGGYYVGREDAFHGHTHPERAEPSILYHNLGGNRFKDVSREVGFRDLSWSGDATTIDVNDDGFADVYMLNMQGANHLWLNEDGRHFRDATRAYFPKTPWGAMGVKVFDFNGDGRLDVFVTDMHSDMWTNIRHADWAAEFRKADTAPAPPDFFPTGKRQFIFGNALFANLGAGRFQDVSDSVGVETYWPWGPSVDDLNADGWDDIFIGAGMNFPHRYGINSVLLNQAGRAFLPSEFLLGIEPRALGATTQVWFTLDCGGADREEFFCEVCRGAGSRAFGCRWGAPGSAEEGHLTMIGSLGTRSAVELDLDGDGDLDIVTNEFNGPPQVLISNLAERRHIHALKVRLRGTRSNRQGLGAQLIVTLPDGRRILKLLDGKSGYLSESDLPLYFGLGGADSALSLEVQWPSGRRQSVAGPIASGRTIDVVEAERPD